MTLAFLDVPSNILQYAHHSEDVRTGLTGVESALLRPCMLPPFTQYIQYKHARDIHSKALIGPSGCLTPTANTVGKHSHAHNLQESRAHTSLSLQTLPNRARIPMEEADNYGLVQSTTLGSVDCLNTRGVALSPVVVR